jgi:hypothetical protein
MADFTCVGHLPPDPVADYRDNLLPHWVSGDLDTLFFAARAHASLSTLWAGTATYLTSKGRHRPHVHFAYSHNGVSAKAAARTASLAAVGDYRRAMETHASTPLKVLGRVHEELSRLHQQEDDDLEDVLLDPFSLPRIKLHASEVNDMEVIARCPRKSSPHVDGWRFEIVRALGPPFALTGLAEAIVNVDVPPRVASFLASATLIPLEQA